MSNLKFTDVDDLPPEELEYAHVSTWERGDADAVEPETSEGAKEGRTYGNLWQSEDDPRAVQLPTLICPTHHIACSKGICSDMGKLIRAEKRKELEAQWEKEGKNKKNKGTLYFLILFFPHNACSNTIDFAQAKERGGAAMTTMKVPQLRLMEIISLSFNLQANEEVLGNIKKHKIHRKSKNLHILDA